MAHHSYACPLLHGWGCSRCSRTKTCSRESMLVARARWRLAALTTCPSHECRQLFRSSQLCPVLSRSVHNPSRTHTARRAPIARRSTRRGHQLSKPSDDLSMLCLDLKALPTRHLPWAGLGLGQPHWLIQKCDVKKSRIHSLLEKNQTTVNSVAVKLFADFGPKRKT